MLECRYLAGPKLHYRFNHKDLFQGGGGGRKDKKGCLTNRKETYALKGVSAGKKFYTIWKYVSALPSNVLQCKNT